jgi:hypothetical protein
MRARASPGPGLAGQARPALQAAAAIFPIAACRRQPFPLLPSQMTDQIIGDPPAPSGRPPARLMATPAGYDQASWPPPRSPAGSGPADHACSLAASAHNLPSPPTARPGTRPEDDRQLRPAHPAGHQAAIATADQAATATPVHRPHHRLPCMTVMPASRGRPRPTTGRRVSTTLGTGGLVAGSARRPSPAQLTRGRRTQRRTADAVAAVTKRVCAYLNPHDPRRRTPGLGRGHRGHRPPPR